MSDKIHIDIKLNVDLTRLKELYGLLDSLKLNGFLSEYELKDVKKTIESYRE